MTRKKLKIERPEGSVMRGGKYVVIEDTFSVDTSYLTGDTDSLLEGEFYNGKWHIRHRYKKQAGQTTAHGDYNIPGFKSNEEIVRYLGELKVKISEKRLGLDKLTNNLGETIKELEELK